MESTSTTDPPSFSYQSVDTKILNLTFKFLRPVDLKECRLVCQNWRLLSTPILLRKGVVVIDGHNIDIIIRWMTSTPKSFFQNFRCDRLTHHSYPRLWAILGDHVKSFCVSHWWGSTHDLTLTDYHDLLLRRCPELKEIEMPVTKKFQDKDAESFLAGEEASGCSTLHTIRLTGSCTPHTNFWRILRLSPRLKKLYLKCQLKTGFWNSSRMNRVVKDRLENLDVLETASYASDSVSAVSLRYVVRMKWNLKHMSYECYTFDDAMINQGIKAATDLESLRLVLCNKKYESWPAHRGQIWFMSQHFSLKYFHLEIDKLCQGPIFCRALVHSIELPKLESLCLSIFEEEANGAEWIEGLFETILQDSIPDYRNIVGRPLRALDLPPGMCDSSCLQPLVEIYPNLRELTLDTPKWQFVQNVFIHWRNVERLTMTLASHDEGKAVNWNLVLAGAKFPMKFGKGKCNDGAAIAQLEKLSSLRITIVVNGGSGEEEPTLVDDVFIYYGLLQLSYIQSVVIKGQNFSDEAIQCFRDRHLPRCHFSFT